MRELAVQSSNDTNTDADRAELQKEADQLAEEITRISNNTEFNTQNLLGGQFDGTFHIGANEGQSLNVQINAMDANSLGVDDGNGSARVDNGDGTFTDATATAGIDISTQTSADGAITAINTAIETVSAERSKLGAYQNRLDHTINNLGTSSENLTAAESRIRDVDYALAA